MIDSNACDDEGEHEAQLDGAKVHRPHERGVTRRTERVDREGEGPHGHHRPDSRIVEELSDWDGEDDEKRRDAYAESERPPKRRRQNPARRTVGLNESGAHSHVPNRGRERREHDRHRGGAVVGRRRGAVRERRP